MRKLLKHRLAKPVIRGVLSLAVLVMWADGGLQWFLPRYVDLALRQTQGLPWFVALPMAALLGVIGALAIVATIQFPGDALELAVLIARRLNGRRSGT